MANRPGTRFLTQKELDKWHDTIEAICAHTGPSSRRWWEPPVRGDMLVAEIRRLPPGMSEKQPLKYWYPLPRPFPEFTEAELQEIEKRLFK